ncbi:MAG: hypothetical protein OXT74_10500 [Candidatus Poribacteria bacterium]|nr:hypothetical protein [Candidatus Poribacteria bacterium]
MRRLHVHLCIGFLLLTSCATFLSEQQYIQVDEEVTETILPSGLMFSIPEKRDIRKIVILGEGTVTNIEIYVRNAEDSWKPIKAIKRTVAFPIELNLALHADAVRIIQKRITGRGRINTVQFYALAKEQQ